MGKHRSMIDPDELLKRHDVPCDGCGYNLRGLATDVCPECGRGFDREAMTYASTDIGFEALTQTWLAAVVMHAANFGMFLEMRAAGWTGAAASGMMAALLVVRSTCLLVFVLATLPCLHALSGCPDVEHRKTRPGSWMADMLASGLAERATPQMMNYYWRAAWAATIVHAALMVIGWMAA